VMLWVCLVGMFSCAWFSDRAIQENLGDHRPFVWLMLLFALGAFLSARKV